MFKIQKKDSNIERRIITGLIISKSFTKAFIPIAKIDLFETRWSRMIAEWCIEYFTKYEDVPSESIQAIFDTRKQKLDNSISDLIAEYLESISDEYSKSDKFNYQLLVDDSEAYVKQLNLRSMIRSIDALLLDGDITQAESLISNFHNISRPIGIGFDLLNDFETIRDILKNRESNELFNLKGKLGQLIPSFCRGQFVAIFAPEKRGKSWWLLEIAMTATTKGWNVAFFSLEMNKEEVLIRFIQSITGRPYFKRDLGCPIPYLVNINGTNIIKYRKSKKELLNTKTAINKLKSLKMITRNARFKIECKPSKTMSVFDLEYQLDIWKNYENFVPDVIVVDYADLLAPIDKHKEFRHQIDETWSNLKSLSQKNHCLVVTATQTKAETQNKQIKKDSASEDKRKASHPDHILALNQTEQEEKDCKMRVSLLFERHGSTKSWKEVVVLQQLAIGRPYLGSFIQDKPKDTK